MNARVSCGLAECGYCGEAVRAVPSSNGIDQSVNLLWSTHAEWTDGRGRPREASVWVMACETTGRALVYWDGELIRDMDYGADGVNVRANAVSFAARLANKLRGDYLP